MPILIGIVLLSLYLLRDVEFCSFITRGSGLEFLHK